MMNNKILVIAFVLLFVSFVSAYSIIDYSVPSEVSLGMPVSATGVFDANSNAEVLCSFYFFDADTGVLVNRATDQYTTSTGRFMMPYFPISEPDFKRDSIYTLTSECGTVSIDANFVVTQRETIGFYGGQEFDYFTTPENTDTVLIWGVMGLIIIFVFGVIYMIYKYAKS